MRRCTSVRTLLQQDHDGTTVALWDVNFLEGVSHDHHVPFCPGTAHTPVQSLHEVFWEVKNNTTLNWNTWGRGWIWEFGAQNVHIDLG